MLKVLLFVFPLFFLSLSSVYADSVEERLTSFVKSFYGNENVEVRLINASVLKRENLRIQDVYFAKIPDEKGEGVLSVSFHEGKWAKKTFVSFKVLRKVKVFIAMRHLSKGEELRAQDLEVREAILERRERYPLSIEEIVGKRLRRDVKPGSTITCDMLENPIMVERGELVDLIFEDERLLIKTKGKALERGRIGETIRVKNINSGKEVFGKVTGERTVLVN